MLVFGRDIGLDLVDPKLACNSLGGRAAVTGEHHDATAAVVNSPDRSGRGWLDGVSHGQQPSRRAVDRNEHHRPALSATLLRGPEPDLSGHSATAPHLLIPVLPTALP